MVLCSSSTLILEYLDDAFSEGKTLTPVTCQDRARMKLWMRKIDDGIHVASRTIGVCIVNRYYYKEADTKKIADYYNKTATKHENQTTKLILRWANLHY